ncbi:hypothetical protein HO173_012960 [Letharia columbiana]|uniref:Uncharacterized protein n=1 Tax=Letharia columbiana TaxID=112416 RepID=A0A8H6FDL7_9LECA|nr:uncharacterized protein HO173_012960 [Letharia columbiana]KAF6224617.1 hypothetical protein HO173_012960 [Letharia columbiana]
MADGQSNHGVQEGNTALLQKLASAVNGHAATATFACGGSVPISDLSTGNLGTGAQNLFPSVTIRWDSEDHYIKQSKISFPLPHQHDGSSRMLNGLLSSCKRATFGVGGHDVLDEKYRKAVKLDTSQFSTDFHPHDCGILDSIQQILLPSTIRGGQAVGIGPQGVRGELYKLNIYSAPSGKFLSHVDTPRGVMQFGSLVVCLPCQHEGGILGFFCHHQYAHSQRSGRKSIPGAFKGVDLAIFSVFHALGLKVGVHPIIENRSENMGGLSARELMRGRTVPREGDFVENCLTNLSGKPTHLRGEGFDEDVEISYDAMDGSDSEEEKEGLYYYNNLEDKFSKCGQAEYTTIVGTKLHGPTFDKSYEEESKEPVTAAWPHQKVPQIVWLNEPMHKEFAHAGLAYGNEATLNYRFSAAAILVVVPPSETRIHTAAPRAERVVASSSSPSTVVGTPDSSGSVDPGCTYASGAMGARWDGEGDGSGGGDWLRGNGF